MEILLVFWWVFISFWTKKQTFLYDRNIKTLGIDSAAKHLLLKKNNTYIQM